MKIGKPGVTATGGRCARGRGSGAKDENAGFASVLSGSGLASIAADSAVAETAPAASLLAVQTLDAVGSATDGGSRDRAIEQAHRLLDTLERLRLEILSGSVPPSRLREIAAMARRGSRDGIDPDLAGVLSAIELRAEVELAKWTRARTPLG